MLFNALHPRGNDVTIHPGHLVVEDHGIDSVREIQLEPFVPAGSLQNFIAVAFEQYLAADEPIPVIVNAETCCFRPRHHCFTSPVRPGLISFRRALRSWKGQSLVRWRLTDLTTAGVYFQITNVHSPASYPGAQDRGSLATVGRRFIGNRFTVSRTGGTGVQCFGFRDRTGNSDANRPGSMGRRWNCRSAPGAGRKLHCQKRGEITRYSSPARLDLASPGLIPTSASVAGRLQRGSG